ncbi:MBL fold metallo-hydrolase [Nocardioides sp. CER19]|uniref:MBL fold metallo-hydrolase n=1 Tax=Nocardioides sp. CER19 TaxID=3038538 RepID=UPI00244862D7|nr:MBL fold metallo-hydrolase [Nocardioides sp. CER19]MDH2415494.1 MBL fold metallo-hydrolase [Nocardioides sp. CER19]
MTDTGFQEIADRIWLARYEWWDVNITLIAGSSGLVVVDTHASAVAARQVVDDVRRLGVGPVTRIVNTHEHFDHTFGNAELRTAYGDVPIHATETAAANTVRSGERAKGRYAADPADPRAAEILETEVMAADTTFASVAAIDLGDRLVELAHPGRGHTAGDLVVRVPDADVVLAGDLLEESGPPVYGDDSFPLDWPTTVDVVLGMLTPSSVVVPGHGLPVDRAWVEQQRNDLAWVTSNVRELAGRGVPLEEAAGATEWPWPTDGWRFRGAIARGYAQLPRAARGLPLA